MKTGSIVNSLITLHGYSKTYIAKKLGISEPTLKARLKDGNFKYREIEILIDLLQIEQPQDIFFKL